MTTSEKKLEEKDIFNLFTEVVKEMLSSITEQNKEMFKAIKDMQVEHFKQLEKTSAKQLAILQLQNKEFMKHLDKSDTPKPLWENSLKNFDPLEVDPTRFENTIEKKEEEQIPLGEMPRIPIVEGINVRFEDREETFPINIES